MWQEFKRTPNTWYRGKVYGLFVNFKFNFWAIIIVTSIERFFVSRDWLDHSKTELNGMDSDHGLKTEHSAIRHSFTIWIPNKYSDHDHGLKYALDLIDFKLDICHDK